MRLLGEIARRARLAAGLRQEDLARRTGVSVSTIKRMESGKGAGVSLASWIAVFSVLGILDILRSLADPYAIDPFDDYGSRKRVRKT
ncbi:helix-turn-helix transcriptional regulator [Thermosulfurimonas sp. F29]|uniref:helix-turn-helix domain-containing protein n=1 Tax=Thermosulfurimonas sp. F29 TaxID=2867247 RepID=UPI001C834012|nr:helix-turn-helix transcriptional regulator [Thermosulfurimonas sp. F29]MBX6423425.1 helix-turn-helix domain-containing protein [Thermosulfurimonas sp. F29]